MESCRAESGHRPRPPHRQQNVVSVYRLFMKDTIEERIRALQERKRELADEILSGEGIGQALISREEVLELLGR